MFWLVSLFVPFFSAPTAPTLVTLSTAHGGLADADWQTQVTVRDDGRWVAGKRSGKLDADALIEVKTLVEHLPVGADPIRETCRARAIFHQSLKVGSELLTESTPCGKRWSPEAADLAERLRELTAPTRGPDASILRVKQASLRYGAWQPTLTVFDDGRWETATGKGKLGKAALEELERAIATTTFEHDGVPVTCEAMPTTRTAVVAGDHRMTYSGPCGSNPHPSVVALLALANELFSAGK